MCQAASLAVNKLRWLHFKVPNYSKTLWLRLCECPLLNTSGTALVLVQTYKAAGNGKLIFVTASLILRPRDLSLSMSSSTQTAEESCSLRIWLGLQYQMLLFKQGKVPSQKSVRSLGMCSDLILLKGVRTEYRQVCVSLQVLKASW